MSVWAVLVAAGRGERLGLDRPKAFARLGERVLLAESLERLEDSEWIDGIVVVVPAGWEEAATLLADELAAGKVIDAVTGGVTRTDSVRAGVAEVPGEAAVILVHDAARPVVPEEVIERVIVALNEGWDGAVPGLPVTDTVKRVEQDAVVETLPRGSLVAVQTPQAFSADALRHSLDGDVDATDCSALLEQRGYRVKVVPGDPRLLKVTEASDLERVAAWL